jgi:hypothetical protein
MAVTFVAGKILNDLELSIIFKKTAEPIYNTNFCKLVLFIETLLKYRNLTNTEDSKSRILLKYCLVLHEIVRR